MFLTIPNLVLAESPAAGDDVQQLRVELTALQRQVAELAARIEALESQPSGHVAAPPPPVEAPPEPPEAPEAPPETPATPAQAGGQKVFNPDIAAIGNFTGAAGKTPSAGEPSLNLEEAELSFQAVVDPYARADFYLTFGQEEVGIEEGFVTFPTLPAGLLVKVGKMRDAFGKVDAMHSHVSPWVDRPLVTTNLLGGEDGLADSGISVARLIPNPWLFLEATAQVYRGESAVFDAPARGDLAYVGHLRAYRDLSESTNVDLGGSVAIGHNGISADSTTSLFGVDATVRYRPLRRAIYTHFLARTELVWSRREDQPGVQDAFGAYGYLEYQFARRWTLGARGDYAERANDPSMKDKGGSFLLTYAPSEFAKVRVQYRHTSFGEGGAADEALFQLLFGIGAHSAHPF